MRIVIVLAAACLVSCGGSKGGNGGSPNAPTPQPQNRAPSLSSVAVNPSFGIADLTMFNFNAIASDPDGDAITYAWDLAGNPGTGPTPQTIFVSPGGNGTARVTVTDSRGATASGTVTFTVGSMQGVWVGNLVGATFRTTLNQSLGGNVTGSFEILTPSGRLITGNAAPVSTNKIDATGRVHIRYKANANVDDFRFEGTMDTTGMRLTGAANGSGFRGQSMNLFKQ